MFLSTFGSEFASSSLTNYKTLSKEDVGAKELHLTSEIIAWNFARRFDFHIHVYNILVFPFPCAIIIKYSYTQFLSLYIFSFSFLFFRTFRDELGEYARLPRKIIVDSFVEYLASFDSS